MMYLYSIMTQNKPLLPSYVDLPGMSQGLPPPRYQNLHSDTRPLPLAKHYGTHHQESSHDQTLYATAKDAYFLKVPNYGEEIYLTRWAMEAIMVPREAKLVPMPSHWAMAFSLRGALEGTTTSHPGSILPSLAIAIVPF